MLQIYCFLEVENKKDLFLQLLFKPAVHVMKKRILQILLVCMSLVSCNDEQKLYDYVYIDKQGIIHANKKCKAADNTLSMSVLSNYGDELLEFAYNTPCFEQNICSLCVNYYNRRALLSVSERYTKEKLECKNEYIALCLLEYDRWGSFEKYYDYVKDKDNRKELNHELIAKGYELDNLRKLIWQLDNEYKFGENDINIMPNESFRLFVFAHLRLLNEYVYTFDKFDQSLSEQEGFLWCYQKCREHNLIDNWQNYIMLMFESDWEYCKEEHWDELEDEMKDYWRLQEDIRSGYY